MDRYLPRVSDGVLERELRGLPAICIEGAKAVGKSASAERLAHSSFHLDRPEELAAVQADRNLIGTVPEPVLIDEWQNDPPIWDAVRRMVDERRTPGRFILTGSADPHNTRIHSGAGRIVRLRMRPLSFAERQLQTPSVSLAGLLHGTQGGIEGRTAIGLEEYIREILNSGLPGMRQTPEDLIGVELASYLDYALSREVPSLGVVVRRPKALRGWLTAYAAAMGGTATFSAISDAVSRQAHASRATVNDYREVLEQLWLLDPLPAWVPEAGTMKRLGQASKHFLADPAFAANLLGASAARLVNGSSRADTVEGYRRLRGAPFLGALFESLATLSVRVYAEALQCRVSHLRTHRGEHEVDIIIETPEGGVLAMEVKLASAVTEEHVKHLNWLADQLGDRLVDRAVITTGPFAYRRTDGIAVVPLALLGP